MSQKVHPTALLFFIHCGLSLIFTPIPPTVAAFRHNDRAKTPLDRFTHETGLWFWTQLIAYTGCPEVLLVDEFEFFADRPTFVRHLFARVTESGQRVSVRSRFGSVEQLPRATHRLAIIVPIVMKPSRIESGRVERFFKQIAKEPNFIEFHRWMFLFGSADEPTVRHALHQLPIRADSSIHCVIVQGEAVPFVERIHLERKMMPTDRFVRRMQMLPHPETTNQTNRSTLVELRLTPNTGGPVSIWQLYRLQTRSKTIDVSVELAAVDDLGRIILYPSRTLEQRNDFFDLTKLTIMAYTSKAKHVNSTFLAQSVPLFRNARIIVRTYQIGRSLNRVDFHFQPIITNNFNKRLQEWLAYSLPLFHEHLNLYIHYETKEYQERLSEILVVTLIPTAIVGCLLCLLLPLSFNVAARNLGQKDRQPHLTFMDCLVWMTGVLSQQGSCIRPNSSSSMILILVGLYFSSIMYCTYLTKITSQLSVDVEDASDLQSLLQAKKYQIGFVGNFTTDQTFTHKRYDPNMHEVMLRMERDKRLYSFSYEDGLERVLNSKYALIGCQGCVRRVMEKFDESNHCNITEINLYGIEQMISLQMSSTYAYRKIINYEILRHYSNGMNNRMKLTIIKPRKKCGKDKEFYHISTSHIKFQLSVLISGATTAVIILAVEKAYDRLKSPRFYLN